MKRFVSIISTLFYALIANAQESDYAHAKRETETERRVHYKEVVTRIFKVNELFVLFNLNLALVVDPTKNTQVVEPITT